MAADGSVTPPADLAAGAGDRIEFKIENGAEEEYYLTVLDADSAEVGEGEAEGGAEGEFIAELPEAGDYRVQVYPDGAEDQAEVFTLTVS